MARRLQYYVHVPDAGGAMKVFGPDDEVPAWAAEKITHEGAWAPDDGEDAAPAGPPPKTGKGSGAGAWAAYAEANGVTFDENASRDDIVAAVTAAGVPTE